MPEGTPRIATVRNLTRRQLIKGTVAGLGGMLSGCGPDQRSALPESSSRYNLLFIHTDQHRFDALSAAGNPYVSTPNLDRLAREGVRFSHAVTPCPVCVPARTSFLTGLSIHTTGYTDNTKVEDKSLNVGAGSFDQLLTRAGYHAEYHGRWHAATQLIDCYRNPVSLDFTTPYKEDLQKELGMPPPAGPGQFVDYLSDWPFDPDPIDYHDRKARGRPLAHGVSGIAYGVSTLPPQYGYSAYLAGRASDALERLQDNPFSLTVALLHPHHPQYVSSQFAGTIDPGKLPVPSTMNDTRSNTPYADYIWQIDDLEKQFMGLIHARYYELVQEVDHHIGRILDKLDGLGLADRTLVIFTTDHGEMLGDHGLTQKFVPYEASIRIPFIMRLPGKIPAGRVVSNPVNSIDILPTVCDYLGIDIPDQEGQSLRPLVEEKDTRSPYTFSEFDYGWQRSSLLTSSEWKYVWTVDPDQVDMLFHLAEDPNETTNLIGRNPKRAKYRSVVKDIRAEMQGWMEQIGHPHLERLARSEIL